jgi:methionyl-tRNA formyltransferase|tara:strand:+ start:54 stop:719 length:666 start_codon:yes stop_codon:yes gene_type:complete
VRKKYKVTFLLDKSNLWFEKQLKNYDFRLNNKYIFKISKNPNNIKNQNIVFPLSYTRILPESFLQKNELVLIAHPSKLPKDKGFAPLQYQILRNKNKVYISLIKAAKEVDAGPIYFQNSFVLNGTELSDEIRNIQGIQFLNIIKKFLIKYPKVKSKKQIGKGNFNKRRYPKDSQLDINKTIKQQFNHLRINDNELYPSFFYYKGQKYIIKVFKEKNSFSKN